MNQTSCGSVSSSHHNYLPKSVNISSDICTPCLNTDFPVLDICTLAAIDIMGINIQGTGTVWTLTAPNGISIDTKRISGAWDTVNKQLPTGSLQGYISQITSNAGISLSNAVRESLYVMLGIIILFIFLLYTIICILLMSHGFVTNGVGITMIIVGLFLGIISLIIVLSEISVLGTKLEGELFSQADTVITTLGCALISGLCCYSGVQCCCSSSIVNTCTNPPGNPSEEF